MAWGEHLPHSSDVDVHGALLHKNVVSPDFVEKLGATVDPIGVSHEKMQQTKLGSLEIDFLTVTGNPMCGRIQPEACDFHDLVTQERRAPAYHRLDSREQLARGEGLGDVIIRSGFEPRYLVRFLCTARQHDDRNVLGALIGAQLPGKTHSGRVGKNPIEKHQRSEEHTSELQSHHELVCRLL